MRWNELAGLHSGISGATEREGSWADLVEMLSRFQTTSDKLAAGAWTPATFVDAAECGGDPRRVRPDGQVARKQVNVVDVQALVVDVDEGGTAARDGILATIQSRGVAAHWHTTWSAADKFRIIIPLSEPVPGAEWWDFWHWALRALGARHAADRACKDSSRLYFKPSTSTERSDDGACGTLDGRPLDVEAIRARGAWAKQPHTTTGPASSNGQAKVYPAADELQLWGAARALEKFGDAIEGQHGDSRTFTAAAILAHDWALSEEEAWPILWRWNEKHCRPPWSQDALREKLANAGAYASQQPRGAAREGATAYQLARQRVEAELDARLGTVAERTEPAKWTWGDELLAKPFPSANWLVRGLVAADTITIIGADPKASKTWTLIDLALAVASGGKALGEFPTLVQGPCLLFLNEDSARSVRNRLRALCAGYGYGPEAAANLGVRTRERIDLADRKQVAELIVDVQMAQKRPVLLGLDPLRNLHSAEENSSTELQPVLAHLAAIRELTGCALVVVHHSAKRNGSDDARTAGARMRGSSALDGFRDGLISLEETEKGEDGESISNTVVVDLKAHRSAGRFAMRLELEDDENGEAIRATWTRTEAAPKAKAEPPAEIHARLSDAVAEVMRQLRRRYAAAQQKQQPPEPYGRTELKDTVAAIVHCKRDTVLAAIEQCVGLGKVTEVQMSKSRVGYACTEAGAATEQEALN